MKLIDILVRELKEWPETTVGYVQDPNGYIWPCIGRPEFDHEWLMGNFMDQNEASPALTGFETADDYSTSYVTREQWKAARQAITPTIETMLTEWRDLEARAQAAQAEADALFEHAGQLHGEIVVRLAELGWGAPRGPVEPVVTLDDELPANVTRFDLRIGDVIQLTGCDDNSRWVRYKGRHATVVSLPACVVNPDVAGEWNICDSTEFIFISRPSTPQ